MGETNSAERPNYLVNPLLYFLFKNLKETNSLSFISFHCILHVSVVFLSIFENFFKLKRADLISWCEPILQNDWIIWSPLVYFLFKNLEDSNFSSFIWFRCTIHDSVVFFSVFENFPKLKKGDVIPCGETVLQNDWIIWSPLSYFNSKNLEDPNSLSLTSF